MSRSTIVGPSIRFLVLLAAVLTVLLGSSSTASAYQHIGVSGRPGAAQAYATQGTHLQVLCGARGYYNCFAPGLFVQGPLVYRSPATTGAQNVHVRYGVHRWSAGSWVQENARDFSGTIGVGQSAVRLPTWNVLTTVGHKRTIFSIVWTDAYGRTIATSAVVMNGNDYACNTRFTLRCDVYNGSVAVYQP